MRAFLDRLGISASILCVIHCLVTPALVVFTPIVGQYFSHEWVHGIMIIVVFPVAIWALLSGFNKHREVRVLWLGGVGLLFMTLGMLISDHSVNQESAFMIIAGICLATAHLVNLRSCRQTHS